MQYDKYCTKCDLCKNRFKLVWGEGNEQAELMFIGEAPGADENIEGRPFVGKAGKILDSLIPLAGYTRDEVYITNIVKCRPPANRPPEPEEIRQCRDYLNQQILEIKPKLIICLGKSAAKALTGLDKDMGSFTSKAWSYLGVRVLVLYHPAATFYNRGIRDKLYKQFIELGHLSGRTKVVNSKKAPLSDINPEIDYEFKTITNANEAVELFNMLYDFEGNIAFDTETTGLDYRENAIIGMSFALRDTDNIVKAWYIPIRHRTKTLPNIAFVGIRHHLSLLLRHKKLILHNAKFDMHMLLNEDLPLENFEDTMLMLYCFNEEDDTYYALKGLGVKYIRTDADRYEKELEKLRKEFDIEDDCSIESETNWADIPIEKMGEYACNDAYLTLRLYELFNDKTNKETYERERQLVPVIMRMERNGLAIDLNYFANQAGRLTSLIASIKEEIYQLAGQRFNIDSKQQLGEILTDVFNFRVMELTKKRGDLVVDDISLKEYYDSHFSRKIIEYRILTKLLNTYIIPIIQRQRHGLIKTDLMQHRTNNGRLSSAHPNLQNLPKHKKKGFSENSGDTVRKGLVKRDEANILVFIDYSQIELRFACIYAEIKEMIEVYKQEGDVHRLTAMKMYQTDAPTNAQRFYGKTNNFLRVYGGGVRPITRILIKEEVELPEEFNSILQFAEWLGKSWDQSYPEAGRFRKFVERRGLENGVIKNLYGRTRHITRDTAWTGYQFLCSSCAADVVKEAMIKVDRYIGENNLKTLMLLQIHDELIFEMPKDEVEHINKIKQLMEVTSFPVPITANVEISYTNWAERQEHNVN